MSASFEGLLVVALEQAVAAPLCTLRLADAGARVIKVERAEGDFAREYDGVVNGESAYFVWLNRGKESIVLDFKNADDAALLHRMIDGADVFVQNLGFRAAERAGFGSAALRERNPRLVTCDISGYGDDGPYREMKAYDLLVQAETGLASVTGSPEGPGRVGVSIADIACGTNAHAAVVQALYDRERTGRGTGVAVSLFDSLAEWMTVPLLHHEYGGRAPARVGLHHPSIAPYGAYPTADGDVVFAVQNEREWQACCERVLQQPALIADPRFATNVDRVANRPALDGVIAAVFARLTREQILQRLRDARIAFGSVNGVAELSSHAALRRMEVSTPAGPITSIAPPARVRGEEDFHARPIPALNQHGDALRREFAG